MFTIRFDIVVFRNRMRITNVKTGQTLDRQAVRPFSSETQLLHDPKGAAAVFKEMIVQLDRHRLWRIYPIATISAEPSGLTTPEALQQFATDMGFVKVTVRH